MEKSKQEHQIIIDESYENAVSALLSPLHQSTTPSAIRAAAARRKTTLQDMHVYLRRMGLDLNDAPSPSSSSSQPPPLILHVTGTKGKGSTLSLCESLLRRHHNLHTGMFTSPHLVDIRERIRIDGRPISKENFGKIYWRVRRSLERYEQDNDHCCDNHESNHRHERNEQNNNNTQSCKHNPDRNIQKEDDPSLPPLPTLPGYFRMMTLMAIYAFYHYSNPRLDVILLEVGMGGRYDATNVFEDLTAPIAASPCTSISSLASTSTIRRILVRGVTLIDYDHTRVLGSTLEQIAWEKGGIFVKNKLGTIGLGDGGYEQFLREYNRGEGGTNSNSDVEVEREDISKMNEQKVVFVSGQNRSSILDTFSYIAIQNGYRLEIVQSPPDEARSTIAASSGLQGNHQRNNAALALSMCRYAVAELQRHFPHRYTSQKLRLHADHDDTIDNHHDNDVEVTFEKKVDEAMANTFWPGRCHTVSLPLRTVACDSTKQHIVRIAPKLRCDGAHTPISIRACINWFRSVTTATASTPCNMVQNINNNNNPNKLLYRALIFNCSHERNPLPLLYDLYQSKLFDTVYFCRADFERPSAIPKKLEDDWLNELLKCSDTHESDDEVGGREECGGTTTKVTLANMRDALASYCRDTLQQNAFNDGKNSYDELAFVENDLSALSWQQTLANVWKVFELYHHYIVSCSSGKASSKPSIKISSGLTVKEALTSIQDELLSSTFLCGTDENARDVSLEVCVTGSLYIVGSALEAAGWTEEEASGDLVDE